MRAKIIEVTIGCTCDEHGTWYCEGSCGSCQLEPSLGTCPVDESGFEYITEPQCTKEGICFDGIDGKCNDCNIWQEYSAT